MIGTIPRAVVAAAALCAVAGPLQAQIPLTPRALGLGGAIMASASGFESVLYNPAHLALPGAPGWSVAFPQISIGSSVLGPDVSDLPDFAAYDDVDDARRQELLALIPESGTSFDLDVRAPVAALQIGRFGVAASYGVLAEHTIGKDLVELFFQGFEEGRFDYRVSPTEGTRATFWDIAAGYGHQVGPVAVGVTGHYYLGRNLVRTQAFEPDIDPFGRTIRVEYAGVSAPGGSGYGLDLGAAYQPYPGVTVSASIANLIGSMSWDEELVGRSLVLTDQDFESSDPADLLDRYEESERELGASPTGRFGTLAAKLQPDAWDIPRTLRLGAAWASRYGTEVTAAYQNQLTDGLLGGRWEQLVGVGVQQRIPLITLRAGASTNLSDGSMIGGGIRLGPMDLGVAKFTTAGTLDENADRDGWAGSFSVSVRSR